MQLILLLPLALASGLAMAEPAVDPAQDALTRAYAALRVRNYDTAIDGFLLAIQASPEKASIRKDLAYAYLKVGENDLAREQFGEALKIEPGDDHTAMEFAYLCYESNRQAEARRIFDRLRKAGNAGAAEAFHNIDAPLAAAIERWNEAIRRGADNFSAHFELAKLAEQRDELAMAAEHYERAWRLLAARRTVLVDLGRTWQALGRVEDSRAALLAASRGGEARAAEMARELLPERYPFVSEFRRALDLDPANAELRRELGYLLLRMGREDDAEKEFQKIAETAPDDLLSATQLAFLLYGRGERVAAMPLFERVMAGQDDDLANRVRAVLQLPQVVKTRAEAPGSIDARIMAERSIKAGYLKDAVQYLERAHEVNPMDAGVMLKLGWTYNMLHEDGSAYRWFRLARKSRDRRIAAEASAAWCNLRPANETFRTTVWLYPIYSTRWSDFFSYGQVKTEWRVRFPIRPYVSVRFIGDTTGALGTFNPIYLSESSFILGVGATTSAWHGITGWAEAGSAIGYLTHHMLPDYRGGISAARGAGHSLHAESPGWFVSGTADGIFVSRFGNDFLVYGQARAGYTVGPASVRSQVYWNGNLTLDSQGQDWANFRETGPGFRFAPAVFPQSIYVSLDVLWGSYNSSLRSSFHDIRVGVWYAFTR
jgi:Flp pilus assembly protein TadD